MSFDMTLNRLYNLKYFDMTLNKLYKLNRLYNLKLPVLKFLGERANHYENEQLYHPNFVWYVERSSLVDISPKSCHLTSFELINQLLYINFPSFECRSEVYVVVVCCVVIS